MTIIKYPATKIIRKWIFPYYRKIKGKKKKVRGHYKIFKLKVNICFKEKKE
jgi:hypothetical protein